MQQSATTRCKRGEPRTRATNGYTDFMFPIVAIVLYGLLMRAGGPSPRRGRASGDRVATGSLAG